MLSFNINESQLHYKTYFTTIRLGKRAAKNNAIGRNAANEFKKSFLGQKLQF